MMIDWSAALRHAFARHLEMSGSSGSSGSCGKSVCRLNEIENTSVGTTVSCAVVPVVPGIEVGRGRRTTGTAALNGVVLAAVREEAPQKQILGATGTTVTAGTTNFGDARKWKASLAATDAEVSFESRVVRWLDQHPASSQAGCCAWCGAAETAQAVVLPFGTEPGSHTWLHAECWQPWHRSRREQAVRAVNAAGSCAS